MGPGGHRGCGGCEGPELRNPRLFIGDQTEKQVVRMWGLKGQVQDLQLWQLPIYMEHVLLLEIMGIGA